MKFLRETLALAGLLAPPLWLAAIWSAIPGTVPVHYNLAGAPNRFAGKESLWLLPVVALFLYVLMLVVTRFPSLFNLPRPLGDPARPRLEALAIDLLGWLRVEIVWIFGFLIWASVGVARQTSHGLPVWFTPVLMLLVFATIAVFLIRAKTIAAV